MRRPSRDGARRPRAPRRVGAGPGDPGLLTLKGKECLEQADVVLYDYLANPFLLQYAPATAQRIYVGRRGRGQYQEQADINLFLAVVEKRQKRWPLQGSISRLCLV